LQGRKEEKKQEKGYYHQETSYGAFERIIDLPTAVDEDKAEAEFSKGVLTIRPRANRPGPNERKSKSKCLSSANDGLGAESEPSSSSAIFTGRGCSITHS
jgi:hypothetical protein